MGHWRIDIRKRFHHCKEAGAWHCRTSVSDALAVRSLLHCGSGIPPTTRRFSLHNKKPRCSTSGHTRPMADKGSFIYGTLILLVIVNLIHFFTSPYLLAYNSLSKFNVNLEDVSRTLEISQWHMLKDNYIPCTQNIIIEVFSYFFVNSMVTISAVSFLTNFKNMPLAPMIPRFDSQAMVEATAFISVTILAVNGVMKMAVLF